MQAVPKLLCLLLLASAACNKKEDQVAAPLPQPRADYMKLKPGNYWIYNEYKVNPAGETDEHVMDSLYVEGDTTINGMVYHTLIKPDHWSPTQHMTYYLRDSLDYVVDRYGRIWFSETDFTSIFYKSYIISSMNTFATVTTKMADKDVKVNTPAGTFLTSSLLKSYVHTAFIDSNKSIARYHTRYAKDVGMVTEVMAIFSFNTEEHWERRLVRYHVK